MLKLSPQQMISTPAASFDKLPDRPGVYILKNSEEKPVYVGKATSIRGRVLAHLRPRFDDAIGQSLRDQIRSADYIFNQSPLEALILENVLIKRYKPKYNIRLKDDKSYPYIRISNDPVPRVLVTRRLEDDGSRYFGPYGNARAARRTVKYLRKIFPIRGCTLPLTWEKKFKSCIDYNIGLCKAPCIFAVTKNEYFEDVKKFELFLDGKLVKLSKVMYDEMWKASEKQDYERASKIRNEIRSLEATALKQRIVFPAHKERDKDIITIARAVEPIGGSDSAEIVAAIVFQVRAGNVIGRERYILDGVTQSTGDSEILSAFIKQHYTSLEARIGKLFPQEIVVPSQLTDSGEIESMLRDMGDSEKETDTLNASPGKLRLALPSESEENQRLMKLAQENAKLVLGEQESKGEVRKRERLRALKDIKEKLDLGQLPRRIECFDISNIRGQEAVGAMTVFVDGFPEKSQYRKFKIKTVKGIDDYSMMAEMIGRRFRRLTETKPEDGKRPWANKQPDLVIIDGGRGHLNAALEQMHRDGVFGIPTVALAKKEELVFTPSRVRPIKLSRDSEALHILQHIRDQAHRFGITYHRKLRSRKITTSKLDEIPGIGEKRKRNLLAHFGSIDAIRRSGAEEIAQVAKINDKLANAIVLALNKQ
ncbi:MAG: excinuclease ABC subunit UvrC [Thaumarchaeota archaeon]|nr:excinuclease ABC subunit UvrC [Nitrososphaerota archaeon]